MSRLMLGDNGQSGDRLRCMNHIFPAVAVAFLLTISACGTTTDPTPSVAEPGQAAPAEPAAADTTTEDTTTTAATEDTATEDTTTTTAAADTTTEDTTTTTAAADTATEDTTTTAAATEDTTTAEMALRAEVADVVTARLSAGTPEGVTGDQIACVAEASAAALSQDRLESVLAALDEPSGSLFPADLVSDLERDRLLDGAAGCLPWSQILLSVMLSTGDIPPSVSECAQAATIGDDTDRLAADIMLFDGDLIAVYNLLLPPDCVPGVSVGIPGFDDADMPTSAAGRLTAAQLVEAGVSPENAACVAAQVDALNETLPQEADNEQAEQEMIAAMFGCLTPEELSLLNTPDGTEG